MKKHGHVSDGKVHETKKYLRFRQMDPEMLEEYRTKTLPSGIILVIGQDKNSVTVKGKGLAMSSKPSRADLENMSNYLAHIHVIGQDASAGKHIVLNGNSNMTKALSTLSRVVLLREREGEYQLTDKQRSMLGTLANARTHGERKRILEGRGFMDVLRTGAQYGWRFFKTAAPFALQLAPVIDWLLESY